MIVDESDVLFVILPIEPVGAKVALFSSYTGMELCWILSFSDPLIITPGPSKEN